MARAGNSSFHYSWSPSYRSHSHNRTLSPKVLGASSLVSLPPVSHFLPPIFMTSFLGSQSLNYHPQAVGVWAVSLAPKDSQQTAIFTTFWPKFLHKHVLIHSSQAPTQTHLARSFTTHISLFEPCSKLPSKRSIVKPASIAPSFRLNSGWSCLFHSFDTSYFKRWQSRRTCAHLLLRVLQNYQHLIPMQLPMRGDRTPDRDAKWFQSYKSCHLAIWG